MDKVVPFSGAGGAKGSKASNVRAPMSSTGGGGVGSKKKRKKKKRNIGTLSKEELTSRSSPDKKKKAQSPKSDTSSGPISSLFIKQSEMATRGSFSDNILPLL